MNNDLNTAPIGRILVVDDAAANLQLLTNLLAEHGYTVYPASTGELALRFVQTTLPDLILLDIRMPGMDGYEVCRRIKADERTGSIPVIFISILEDERDKVKGFQLGAVDYITKPFQPDEVLARVGTHLRLRELTERLEQKVGERTEELRIANQRLQQEIIERKHADETLRESEERYRMVFENSPVSIWEEDFSGVKTLLDDLKREGVSDIETYFDQHPETLRQCADLAKIVDVNRAALALHGAAKKEELLAGLANTFTPESFDSFRRELVCLWNGGTRMTRDAVVRTLAGDLRDVTVYFAVCPGHEETLSKVVVSLVNVTERKRAEETLKKTSEGLQRTLMFDEALLSAIPAAVFYKDREGRYLGCNRAFTEIMGVTTDEIRGKTVYDLWPMEHSDEYHRRDLDLMANPARQIYEFRVRDKDGLERPVIYTKDVFYDENNQVAGIIGTFMDITDRKQAEEKLRALNEELDQRVKERTAELEAQIEEIERMNRLFVGRELRMIELKDAMKKLEREISSLRKQSGRSGS
jgi:PAS domain S-box-containing protein